VPSACSGKLRFAVSQISALLPINALASAYRRNVELIADLPSKPIVNFGMARYWSFCARYRVVKDRMPSTFPGKSAPVPAKMIQQFLSFHFGAAPA
jgi:hypothetical protein